MKVAVVGAGANERLTHPPRTRGRRHAAVRVTHCGVGGNLTLHVQHNEIVEVTSPHDNPVTHGNLCIKGRFGFQHVQNRV